MNEQQQQQQNQILEPQSHTNEPSNNRQIDTDLSWTQKVEIIIMKRFSISISISDHNWLWSALLWFALSCNGQWDVKSNNDDDDDYVALCSFWRRRRVASNYNYSFLAKLISVFGESKKDACKQHWTCIKRIVADIGNCNYKLAL